MPVVPVPSPALDNVPPSPSQLGAGEAPENLTFEALQPQVSLSADTQTVQVALETAAAIGKGLDLLGQMFPNFGPTGSSLQDQLRAALKTALEQGFASSSEPSQQPRGQFSGLVGQ